MTKQTKVLFLLIILLALGLRVYKLGSAPPSISWDEAAVGYNAWAIANYGKDESGQLFPLYFRSFGEGKNPVDIYITSIFVKFLGLNEISTRLPSAVFGVLNVFLIFFLAKILFPQERTSLFGNEQVALLASFFLAISPYNIHFSRFNHEANFTLFFLILGIILFYLHLKKSGNFLSLSVIAFIVSFLSYNPSKLVVPLIVLLLVYLHWKVLIKDRLSFLISFCIGIIFIFLIFLNPQILGTERIKQTSLSKEAVEKTRLYRITNNEILGRVGLTMTQYLGHFAPWYLFETGDDNPRLSPQSTGEFYKLDVIFLVLGVFYLIYRRSRESVVLLAWALIASLPSSLAAEAPHAGRAALMMGSWHLISALGLYFIISLVRRSYFKTLAISVTIIILIFLLKDHLNYYFGEYAKRYAIEWQYGMKQVVSFVKENPQYGQVYMTDKRSQPYIFFLYYLKTPLPQYLNTVLYNNSENKSYNLVSGFDKYYFGGSNMVESKPDQGVLYILTPSEYDGLMYKSSFNVKKVINYPNGTVAFYIVI